VGKNLPTAAGERVNVHVEEVDDVDEVVIAPDRPSDVADARNGLTGNSKRSAEAGRPPEGRPVT
jgi:hypothetical protein